MTDTMILHHYYNSPYAEKIRLMFGLTNLKWKSLLSPIVPPRPNVDPLTGGYRRIPVAQIGADIFCDTSLIAEEIANLSGHSELIPANIQGEAAELAKMAEQKAFFAAAAAVPPLRLMGTMLSSMGPLEIISFVKDRLSMLKGGTQKQVSNSEAKQILAGLFVALDAHLTNNKWLAGDKPSVADFAVYHPLWLHVKFSRRPLQASETVLNWYNSVAELGHGEREETSQAYVFQLAKALSPRELPESISEPPIAIGTEVSIAPTDYGLVPVTGKLAAITEKRVVIARETEQFGLLHVHFPRNGYALVRKN